MMKRRLEQLAARYAQLRVTVVGDVCLDRYLEIDPARKEISLETGLPVHNVVNVRNQLGGAGNVVANLGPDLARAKGRSRDGQKWLCRSAGSPASR